MSKLKKLNYIKVKYENSKRRIYLNTAKIPITFADKRAEKCSNDNASSCTHNINNKYKKINKRNIPYWMEHPEVCVSEPLSEEEQRELNEIMNSIN